MVLFGWTQAPAVEKNGKVSADNGASTSDASQAAASVAADEDDDVQIITTLSGKKRKLADVAVAASSEISSAAKEPKIKRKAEEIDGNSDVVMLDDGDSANSTKKGEP